MSNSFGQVIPVVGTILGFLGEVTRSGGGNPFIISKQANAANAANINFADAVVIMPDSTGGTCKQYKDWQANGGSFTVSTTTATSTTLTPTSLNGISNGMLAQGAGIPAGTYITAVNWSAGTVTISKAATASATVTLSYAKFAGFAVREVKTQLGYPYTPGASQIGSYSPGQYVGILTEGGIIVNVPVGTPVAEGPAYLRNILNGSIPAGLVGSIETQPDGVNDVLLAGIPGIAGAYFKTGVLDSNNNCELVLLNRVAA